MLAQPPQSLQSHTRFDPLFHFVIIPVLLINVIMRIYDMARFLIGGGSFDLRFTWAFVVSAVLLLLAFKTRLYALKVQDRLIRLEERWRMMSILPEPLRARIGELTEPQFIALRFASDEELTEAVRAALDKQLPPKEIKQSIRLWRPDYFRV